MVGADLISSKSSCSWQTQDSSHLFSSQWALYLSVDFTRVKYAGIEGVMVSMGHDLCMLLYVRGDSQKIY